MRIPPVSWVLALALAGLLSLAPAALAADSVDNKQDTFKPALVLRLKPLGGLIDDLKYLVKLTQREQIGKQVEGILKGLTGPNGLEGVDTKKPLGLYADLNASLDKSQVMLLVPIANQKEFLTFLENLDFKVEKAKDGLYTLTVENVPFPILFRFAHGYAFATLKFANAVTVPAVASLPKPDSVLGKEGGLITLTANVDRIPNQIRKLGVSYAAKELGDQQDKDLPHETEKQKELRGAMLDELTSIVKQVLEDGGAFKLQLDIDQKNRDLSLSVKASGKPNSTLAKNLAALGKAQGLSGLVSKDSAIGGWMNLSLPADVVKHLGPVIDEGMKNGLGKLDENTRKLVEPLAKALEKTAKAGTLDTAVDLRGPNKNGKFVFVSAVRVVDGDKIEAAVKKVVGDLPENTKKAFEFDADRAEGVNIHKITQTKVDRRTSKVLGDGPLYFAVRKDALFLVMGEGALPALKAALATKPQTTGLLKLEASLARIAPLIAQTRKNAVKAAKTAFQEKGSDKVTLSIESGEALVVKVRVKTAVLTFAALLDAEKKQDREKPADQD